MIGDGIKGVQQILSPLKKLSPFITNLKGNTCVVHSLAESLTFNKNACFMFFLSCVCYAFVRVCLYVLCGHLLGKG